MCPEPVISPAFALPCCDSLLYFVDAEITAGGYDSRHCRDALDLLVDIFVRLLLDFAGYCVIQSIG